MRFLEVGLGTSRAMARTRSGTRSRVQIQGQIEPQRVPQIPVSQILRYIKINRLIRPFEPINLYNSLNKPQMASAGWVPGIPLQVPTQLRHPGYTPPHTRYRYS